MRMIVRFFVFWFWFCRHERLHSTVNTLLYSQFAVQPECQHASAASLSRWSWLDGAGGFVYAICRGWGKVRLRSWTGTGESSWIVDRTFSVRFLHSTPLYLISLRWGV
ncbi:hypothetical protein BZA05DRAFT_408266 [Tricharina praecox]|uniref:uncharacterized protein n=1 Tax=Tricharina praecox TaxID=43433 RepID=UPI00221F269B|nr:uncharacterized protein BZA05DRAFT_408266 [Tricharina praecox]KAI5845362.1 hypothetical protein BZA05DRAFT_408266 [Tricharina praecox]